MYDIQYTIYDIRYTIHSVRHTRFNKLGIKYYNTRQFVALLKIYIDICTNLIVIRFSSSSPSSSFTTLCYELFVTGEFFVFAAEPQRLLKCISFRLVKRVERVWKISLWHRIINIIIIIIMIIIGGT